MYFAWSRFNGNGSNAIYFSRSTDHGVTFSAPMKLTASFKSLQFPDIAVTGNGHVYVTFRTFEASGPSTDAVGIAKSTDCGKTFSPGQLVTPFIPSDAQDVSDPEPIPMPQSQRDDPLFGEDDVAAGGRARDCGDFDTHCLSGYTFFRRDTQVRSTADQLDKNHEWIYVVYDATKPDTQAPTGTTYATVGYGTDGFGIGGQAGIFFLRYDGAAGTYTTPKLIDNHSTGHQVFPDISADGGVLHAIWWDSRNDACYDVTRPIGNCPDRRTVASLDVFASSSTNGGTTWSTASRLSNVTTNPNYEQFNNRTVPFAGDYLWVTSLGKVAYAVWTDWRNTLPGIDPREVPEDEDAGTSDVTQCRVVLTSTDRFGNTTKRWSGDRCPHAGGIDQNIYGNALP
ncbi:MAG: exo-alpha-sialidase [Betaproteobacteria bacterium]|nr:MAG: exo-alpha-sialidase [Betaproteobacteria bacterium]